MLDNISSSVADLRYGVFSDVHRDQYNFAFGPPDKMETELRNLLSSGSLDASFDSARRHPCPRCFMGTRTGVLSTLSTWSLDPSSPSICFLLGKPSSGKSTIAQTFAEICHSANTLAGSYFFSSRIENCSSIQPVVPTLASQLIISVPELKSSILSAIQKDPLLTSRIATKQMQELVISPFRMLQSQAVSAPKTMVVIMDGLEECKDTNVAMEIIFMLSTKLKDPPIPLKFLITGRPSAPHIQSALSSSLVNENVQVVNLDSDEFNAHNDVALFLKSKLEAIYLRHSASVGIHHMAGEVPSDHEIEIMARNTAGSFESANQMIRYIDGDGDSGPDLSKVKEVLRWSQSHPPQPSLLARFIHDWDNSPAVLEKERVKGIFYGMWIVYTFFFFINIRNLILAALYGLGLVIASIVGVLVLFGVLALFFKTADHFFWTVRRLVVSAWRFLMSYYNRGQ